MNGVGSIFLRNKERVVTKIGSHFLPKTNMTQTFRDIIIVTFSLKKDGR